MKISEELQQKLAGVQMLVFDVDGVLTPGQIIYTDSGQETKAFDVKDGLGIRVASGAGLKLAVITGRVSQVVQRRARDLRITHILQRVGDKQSALRELAAESGIPLSAVAYMGDDLNDRNVMRIAGVSIAPADAAAEIREEADLVTDSQGGRGAARQAVEAILRAQGRWEQEVERYLTELTERERGRPGDDS